MKTTKEEMTRAIKELKEIANSTLFQDMRLFKKIREIERLCARMRS